MSTEQTFLDSQKAKLEKNITQLEQRIAQHNETIGTPCQSREPEEIAEYQIEQARTRGLLAADTEMLKRSRVAIRRINEDEYQDCRCGEEIEKKRLIAYPTACLCMECETKADVARRNFVSRQVA